MYHFHYQILIKFPYFNFILKVFRHFVNFILIILFRRIDFLIFLIFLFFGACKKSSHYVLFNENWIMFGFYWKQLLIFQRSVKDLRHFFNNKNLIRIIKIINLDCIMVLKVLLNVVKISLICEIWKWIGLLIKLGGPFSLGISFMLIWGFVIECEWLVCEIMF